MDTIYVIFSFPFCFVGVMAAQGILNNPAMYAGYDITPRKCVQDWVSETNFVITAVI